MEHVLRLAAGHGFGEVDREPALVPGDDPRPLWRRRPLGIELTYSEEEKLLGTAGGVRNVADYLTRRGDSFVVMAADALTDIDLRALAEAHRAIGGIATLAVKRVPNISEYGVSSPTPTGACRAFRRSPIPPRLSRTSPTA